VGTDRAQGVSAYDSHSLIVNIERITAEDGKGLGEMYRYYDNSTFRHKIAIVRADNDIERMWQKQYDEALLAFYGNYAT
jgi:hypothetical protein